jgi:RHS repeat-associated protein
VHRIRVVALSAVVSVIGSALAIASSPPAAASAVAASAVAARTAAGNPTAPSQPYVVHEDLDAATDHTDPAWLHPSVTVPPATEADVDVPADGWTAAGSLPVSVARPASGIAPSRVHVRMLSQAEVAAAGGHYLGFEVSRADGGSALAQVAVSLDYTGIAQAYGGDFASRLYLAELSGCAPCGKSRVPTTNVLATKQLRATTLPVRGDALAAAAGENTTTAPEPDSGLGPQTGDAVDSAMVLPTTTTFAAMSSASGPAGDYTASALSASDNWTVGIGSGGFTYSYPVSVPPAVAGPAPALSFDYSSQAVDGRNILANGQAPKVGEGWDFEPGFIERKFHGCGSENGTSDFCWSANNAYYLHFMGQSGELIRNGSTNEWRLRGSDPAWRVLSFTGGSNGDNDGEYFVVITPDGTRYWFGYGTEPHNTPALATNSADEMPVYGSSGEPCYSAVASASWCQQTYRWNLDRVLDLDNNVTSLFYTKEYNYYSRGGVPTRYVRSSYLDKIEYGLRNGAEDGTAYGRVLVSTMDRCAAQSGCTTPTTTSSTTDYPDVPLDLMCTATSTCTNPTPTFWSTKEITSVATSYWSMTTASYQSVSVYDLAYTLPPTGDTTTPSLWLTSITKTGDYGAGSTALPGLRMTGVNKRNRVNSGTGVPPLNKYRVETISTDLGARYTVTYGLPDPCPLDTDLPSATNPYDCYPLYYDNGTSSGWVPFYKYVVTDVLAQDFRGNQPDVDTDYTYLDTPAWHYDDSLLAGSSPQSWSDYRGYSKVKVHVAGTTASEGHDTRYTVFRGMYGDKLTATTSKTTTVSDSSGATFNDVHYLAGMALEEQSLDSSGVALTSTLHRYWAAQTINGPDGWQSHDTQYVRESRTVARTKNLDNGGWRDRDLDMTFDATTGQLLSTSDEQMPSDTSDDTCVKLDYTNNTTTGSLGGSTYWILDAPYRSAIYAGACGSGTSTQVARTDLMYDGHAWTAAPTAANVTSSWQYAGATRKSVTNTTYDSLGRATSVVRPNEVAAGTNVAETIVYGPATGYPYTDIKTTDVLGNVTKTQFYSAFGTPRTITDPNGQHTDIAVDHLGRTTSVTLPGDDPSLPSVTFAYNVFHATPNRVTTNRLLTSAYVTTYDYVDGFGRTVQTQLPEANGTDTTVRRLVQTRYDSLGQKWGVSDPFQISGAPGSSLAVVALTDIPHETRYGYDALSRVTVQPRNAFGVEQFRTSTTYHGLSHTVSPPVHSDTDYYIDVAGRTTQIVEHLGSTPITTNYTFNRVGDLTGITDDAGNPTDYTYDWLHRRTSSNDPDQGLSSTTYDDEGDVLTTTDAKGDVVTNVYDRLRRRTDTWQNAPTTGIHLAHWTYDNTTVGFNGKGRLASATSYDGANAYTTAVTGYDARGRVTGRRWDIPTAAGALGGSYSYGYTYDSADNLASTTFPSVGGLSQETVSTTRNDAGLPANLGWGIATNKYVTSTTYGGDGRVASRLLNGGVNRTYTYDAAAGRLSTIKTTAPIGYAGAAVPIEDVTYGYDDDSNVTSVADAMAGADGVAQRECFGYDGLDRLTSAYTTNATTCPTTPAPVTFGSDPYSAAYTYDTLGDIQTATLGGTTKAYTYPATSLTTGTHVHAAATVGGAAYDYDKNGALIHRPATVAQDLTWNALHQLTAITGTGGSTFVYDADGNRLLRTTGATTTLYLDSMELTANGGTVTATRYYGPAMRTPAGITLLLHNDQNSTTAAYDVTAKTTTYQRYTPYGTHRGTALTSTDHGFLDKTEDGTGLVAMGARYYDPSTARFTSVDPLSDLAHPQSLAAYSYALGNPATLSDPSGLVTADPSTGGSCTLVNGKCADDVVSTTPTSSRPAGGTAADQTRRRQILGAVQHLDTLKAKDPEVYSEQMTGFCLTQTAEPGTCEQRFRADFVSRSLSSAGFLDALFAFTAIITTVLTLGVTLEAVTAALAADATVFETGAQVGADELTAGSAGSLQVVGSGFSASEQSAAEALAAEGRNVILRQASGVERMSDLVVDGVPYDVYTPTTGSIDRIISAIASKGSQVNGGGIVLDLSKSSLSGINAADLLARVQGVTNNVSDIIIMGD